MSAWNDFNDAEQQQSFDLIPKGTVGKPPVSTTLELKGFFCDPYVFNNGVQNHDRYRATTH